MDTILEWPELTTYCEVQVFLGFTNFYRRFIYDYSEKTAPLISMLQGSKNGKKTRLYVMPEEVRLAFHSIK